nr:hypothetical protein CFP56_11318 [Quercus suber]
MVCGDAIGLGRRGSRGRGLRILLPKGRGLGVRVLLAHRGNISTYRRPFVSEGVEGWRIGREIRGRYLWYFHVCENSELWGFDDLCSGLWRANDARARERGTRRSSELRHRPPPMGNEQSQIAVLRAKVSEVLPPYKAGEKDPQRQRYMNVKDREQFISALLVVLSNNAIRDLKDHQFALLYSRRADAPERVVARIVASKDGVIRAKAEPTRGPGWEGSGRDHDEAFRVLKRYVEARLDEILQALPAGTQDGGRGEEVRVLGQVLGGGKSAEALDEQESVVDVSVVGGSQETLMAEPGQQTEGGNAVRREGRGEEDAPPPAYDASVHDPGARPGHGGRRLLQYSNYLTKLQGTAGSARVRAGSPAAASDRMDSDASCALVLSLTLESGAGSWGTRWSMVLRA